MTDMLDKRIECLQGQQESKRLIEQMKMSINVLTAGGAEAIREVANDDPELILTAITMCVRMIDRLQTSNDQLLEFWFASMDNFDKIVAIIQKPRE